MYTNSVNLDKLTFLVRLLVYFIADRTKEVINLCGDKGWVMNSLSSRKIVRKMHVKAQRIQVEQMSEYKPTKKQTQKGKTTSALIFLTTGTKL